jgi:hypothetical protein
MAGKHWRASAPWIAATVLAACAPASSGGGGPSVSVETLSGSIRVDWTPVAEALVYRVYWSATPPLDLATAPFVSLDEPPFLAENLSGTYHLAVQPILASGPGEASATVAVEVAPDSPERYFPSWAEVAPTNELELDYDGTKTSAENALVLESTIGLLMPGDILRVGGGTWSSAGAFRIDVRGTAAAPIRVVAKDGETPILTRPDASQNALEIGTGGGARCFLLRGFEITGGSIALRLHDCQNVWIDQCHVHDCPENAITANSHDVTQLHFTRNEVHSTGGTGEGFYIGANDGAKVASRCVIAMNHVYDTGGFQGDGIEVKQGSWGNWIVENTVHDTNYPCILVYGTNGRARNVIERNVCWNSGDNVMQVQGEALVRNNALFGGAIAFHSGDHQGSTRDLVVVHNSFFNDGLCVNLASWGGRPGMVFANNAAYSQGGTAVQFGSGSSGVTFTGNVVRGGVSGIGTGYVSGTGLADFAGASYDGSARDVTPAPASPLTGAAAPAWVTLEELDGSLRGPPYAAGAAQDD